MQGNWYHLVGLIIIVGFSVISWIFRQLSEQAAKKRARDLLEERQREMLRTGQDPLERMASRNTEEDERRREIAARREAQLAELRRRAQLRQQGGERPTAPPTTAPPPIVRIPGSAGPTVPQRRAEMGPTRSPIPTQPSRQRPQHTGDAPRGKAARPVSVTRPVAVLDTGESTTHRLVPEAVAARRSPVVMGLAPQTAEEWQRAIIANEILSPPISMRDQPAPVPF